METELRVFARGQHHAQLARTAGEEDLKPAQGLGGLELVEVVDDEDGRLRERSEVRQ